MVARSRHTGQALVEFALLASLLITLLLGIFDFGRAYYTQVQIKNAVGDGGYYAFQHATDNSGIQSTIKRQLSNLNSSNLTINVSCASSSSKKISVSYQYSLVFTWIVPSAKVTLGDETTVPLIDTCA